LKDGTTLNAVDGDRRALRTARQDGVLISRSSAPGRQAVADAIKAVSGVLTIHFQEPPHAPPRRPDAGAGADAGGLSVRVTARGRRSLTLQTDTGRAHLYVRLTDAEGARRVVQPEHHGISDGAWRFELAPQDRPPTPR